MIKGLYAAASAMLANVNRQAALAHNIANLDTPGFKQVLLSLEDFRKTGVVYPPGLAGAEFGRQYIGELGLGVEPTPETTDFTEGPLQVTGNPLDLAIQGSGFFRVQTPNGERYTRDGRFMLDTQNQLVTVDGYKVLNEGGQPITLPEGSVVAFAGNGMIYMDGVQVAQLGIAAFTDPGAELTRDLPNTFAAAGAPTGTVVGTVQQGVLEMPNANTASLMTQMVAVARAYEAAQQMVQNQDELLGKAITSLGSF